MQHRLAILAALLSSAILAACFNPSIPSSGVLCSVTQGCPAAQRCEATIGACVDASLPAVASLRFRPLTGPFEATVDLPGIEVELLDARGQVTPVSGGHLDLSIGEAPIDVQLLGSTAATPHDGVASFASVRSGRPTRRVKLRAEGGSMFAVSELIDVLPTRPTITKLPSPSAISGCGVIAYTVAQAQDLTVDLLVEIDPDGASGPAPYRRATQAESAPGQAGISGVPALRAGEAHTFTWSSSTDVPRADVAATLKITPSIQGLAGPPATTPVQVLNAPHFALRNQPWRTILVADVDGDGWSDELEIGDNILDVEYGPFTEEPNGGTLSAAALTPIAYDLDIATAAIGDFDHDGHLDLALVGADGELSLARATATPRTFEATSPGHASGVRAVAAGDLDGDGRDDLAVVSQTTSGSALSILRQRSSGPSIDFEPRVVWSGPTGAVDVVIGDLNHDAAPDLVVGRSNGPVLVLAQASARGTFEAPFSSAELVGSSVGITDLDHDGHQEIAALGHTGLSLLEVAPRPGVEPDGAVRAFAVVTGTRFVTGDVDGDGRTDITTTDASGSHVHLHVADRTVASFLAPLSASSRAGASLWLTDLDRDGRMDVITAGPSTTAVNLSVTARTCGIGLGSPLGSVAGSGGRAADINGDGKLDIYGVEPYSRHALAGYGLGGGRFAPPVAVDDGFGNAILVDDVIFADLDGDGLADRIEVTKGSTELLTRIQDHAHPGSYLKGSTVDLGIRAVAVSAADVDLDGAVDVLAMGDDQVVWRPGNPRAPGTFLGGHALPVAVEAGPTTCTSIIHCGFTIADLDGDDWPEVVVETHARLQVLRGNPLDPGAFEQATTTDFEDVRVLGTGDLVDDARRELVVRDTDVDFRINVLAMDPDGRLRSRWVTMLPSGFTSATVGDLDGDGRDDLAIGDRHRNTRIVTPRDVDSGGAVPATHQISATGDVSLGDFDQDGRPDLVVCGRSCLHFSAATLAAAMVAPDPWIGAGYLDPLVMGDVNDDGLVDLAFDGHLQRQRQDAPATFAPLGDPVDDLALLADVDRNGFDDSVGGGTPLTVGLVDGDGAVRRVTCAAPLPGGLEQAADVDRDGRTDVVRAQGGEVRLVRDVLEACAAEAPIITYDALVEPGRLELRDMNSDGWLDVVLAYAGGDLEVALQEPQAGSFADPTYYNTSGPATAILDLDRDGALDVLVAGAGVEWWRGNPIARGQLMQPETLLVVASITNVLAGDVNGDGLVDLAVENTGGIMQVYLHDASPGIHFSYAYDTVGRDAADHSGTGRFLDLDADGRLDFLYTDSQRGTTLVRGR